MPYMARVQRGARIRTCAPSKFSIDCFFIYSVLYQNESVMKAAADTMKEHSKTLVVSRHLARALWTSSCIRCVMDREVNILSHNVNFASSTRLAKFAKIKPSRNISRIQYKIILMYTKLLIQNHFGKSICFIFFSYGDIISELFVIFYQTEQFWGHCPDRLLKLNDDSPNLIHNHVQWESELNPIEEFISKTLKERPLLVLLQKNEFLWQNLLQPVSMGKQNLD